MANCNSCGIPIQERGDVVFSCPKCGGSEVGRCKQCRDQGVAYLCPECGFRGP
ncbi:MAG: zinc finger domain-containing protein [Candidatus Thermoplasmatota archaeon]|nr:zinc finger domain-containing protein [Candidatus Thermoplasmatota archaeon]